MEQQTYRNIFTNVLVTIRAIREDRQFEDTMWVIYERHDTGATHRKPLDVFNRAYVLKIALTLM
jgi:hypothetical protein